MVDYRLPTTCKTNYPLPISDCYLFLITGYRLWQTNGSLPITVRSIGSVTSAKLKNEQTEKQKDKQVDKQAENETGRQTDRQQADSRQAGRHGMHGRCCRHDKRWKRQARLARQA